MAEDTVQQNEPVKQEETDKRDAAPRSSNKTKIEIGILIVLLIAAAAVGIPAYQTYMQLEKAIAIFQEGDECLHRNDIPGAKAKFEECIVVYPELRGAYEELAAIALIEILGLLGQIAGLLVIAQREHQLSV